MSKVVQQDTDAITTALRSRGHKQSLFTLRLVFVFTGANVPGNLGFLFIAFHPHTFNGFWFGVWTSHSTVPVSF